MGDNASHFDGGGTIANRCASGYKGQVVWWVWVMAEAFGGEHIGVKESEDLTLGE